MTDASPTIPFREPLALVDLETTGTSPVHDRITEVAVVLVDDGRVSREWSSLVNPGISIPPFVQELTGITNAMVADAPRFETLAGELFDLLDGRTLVAHNARFDYGFLRNAAERAGFRYTTPVLCTVRLSRRLAPELRRHGLSALKQTFGIHAGDSHRALADTRAMWDVMRALAARVPDREFVAVAERLLQRPTMPPNLDEGVLDELPSAPGVYRFYGEKDVLLYVGKSVDIRSRVMSHFNGDRYSGRELTMSRQVRRIEAEPTAGELGALLLEAELVKRLQPVHNRRLRRHRRLTSWQLQDDPAQPPLLRLVELDRTGPGNAGRLHGLYRTAREAKRAMKKLADEHRLCHREVGLEKPARGPCFRYQLNKCGGVCAGSESRNAHFLRVVEALADIRVPSWPWAGPVGVREGGPAGEREAVHVFDRWCWLGTADSLEGVHELREGERLFDLDSYRILQRFLHKRADRVEIVPL